MHLCQILMFVFAQILHLFINIISRVACLIIDILVLFFSLSSFQLNKQVLPIGS